jgi:hypothetical protein
VTSRFRLAFKFVWMPQGAKRPLATPTQSTCLYYDLIMKLVSVCLDTRPGPARPGSLRTREIAGRRFGRVDGCFADNLNLNLNGSLAAARGTRRRRLLLLGREEEAAARLLGAEAAIRVPVAASEEHLWTRSVAASQTHWQGWQLSGSS